MKWFITLIVFITSLFQNAVDDREIANRIFADAVERELIEKPMGDIIVDVGRKLIGSPYEAGTLDRSEEEQLIVNLRSFDCVTFVENVLVLARCIKSDRMSFDSYTAELQRIRYRNGVIEGYPSRLHYFTDWIYDNERKGIVEDVTRKLGGKPYRRTIDFMTTHRTSYPRLGADSVYRKIKAFEDSINTRDVYYIPKSQIPARPARPINSVERAGGQNLKSPPKADEPLAHKIPNGDLIAITTSKDGLDVAHTGIAVRLDDGSIHLLHAPDVGDKVKISKETLEQYLRKHGSQTGIIVVRANPM